MNSANSFEVGAWADGFVDRADGTTQMQGMAIRQMSPARANFQVGGYFVVECWDKDGNLRWETTAENGVTDAGINHLLNVEWAAATQATLWYLIIIDNTGSPVLAAADTMSSHAGWSEVAGGSTSDATRVQWSPTTSTAKSLVNASSADYHMIATVTVFGLGLTNNNTKGGTTGVLSATAPFNTGPQVCQSGDTLRSTYTMGGASN